jgi:hypothetical protein
LKNPTSERSTAMKKKLPVLKLLPSLISLLFFSPLHGQLSPEVIVRPKEIHDVLLNPGIGFTTFQRFNGDSQNVLEDCCGDFKKGFPFKVIKDKDNALVNPDYPLTTVAYFRFYWMYIEPAQGSYRWDIIDKALATAKERNQTLMLSLMPYGTENRNDVPGWYRQLVGDDSEFRHANPVNKWLVDPEDPRYVEHYGNLIRELGKRYDGHPDLLSVDVRIVGAWGEGGGTALLSKKTAQALMDAYLNSFKKTPLKVLLTDEFSNRYAISQADVGYRADCLGDLGFWATDQNGWTHMFDYYPQGIIDFGLQDAWKKGPVSFEMCGTFPGWINEHKYTPQDVRYIFEQALKWHISSFNGKSTAIPEIYKPQVEEFLKKMGYRFVLRKFTYPRAVRVNEKLSFSSWWENKGVAPCYQSFRLAIRLKNKKDGMTFLTSADIREWMPGDNLYNDAVFIPADAKAGEYDVQLSLVDPATGKPKVLLAIEGKDREGWYTLGKIDIK